jgi:hypothetical protein
MANEESTGAEECLPEEEVLRLDDHPDSRMRRVSFYLELSMIHFIKYIAMTVGRPEGEVARRLLESGTMSFMDLYVEVEKEKADATQATDKTH